MYHNKYINGIPKWCCVNGDDWWCMIVTLEKWRVPFITVCSPEILMPADKAEPKCDPNWSFPRLVKTSIV